MVDLANNQPTVSFPIPDPTEQKPIKNQPWRATSIGVWGSNKPNDFGVQFRSTESKVLNDDDESGICSPPLWSKSPTGNDVGVQFSAESKGKHYYRSLSPASKTQAIERGQRELMEMVRSMPESNYELTLKDLVEHQRVGREEENKVGEKKSLSNKNVHQKKEKGKVDHHHHKGQGNKRSGKNNIDSGGFYLKMVFPISLGSNKQKKKNKKKENLPSSKVSPRTSASDKDWWKKSLSASGGESESGVSSINSGSLKSSASSNSTNSSRRSNSRHEMSASSCWPFIRRPESLSQK